MHLAEAETHEVLMLSPLVACVYEDMMRQQEQVISKPKKLLKDNKAFKVMNSIAFDRCGGSGSP